MTVEQMVKDIKNNCALQSKDFEKRLASGSEKFAIIDLQIQGMNKWQADQNGSLLKLSNSIADLCKKQAELEVFIVKSLGELKHELVKGRPSWATSIIITFLSSIAIGAIVALTR